MAYKPMFGSRKRESLWLRECNNAALSGCGCLPICNICHTPVRKADAWHESHLPWRDAPIHLRTVGIAHAPCNLLHNNQVVTPGKAKARRLQAIARGEKVPGTGRHPMPCGALSGFSRAIGGRVKPRQSLAEKHAATMAKRAILTLQPEAKPGA